MNVHALSLRNQRLLALVLFVFALACAFLLIAQPVASAFTAQTTRIDRAEADLVRWQGVIASETEIAAAAASLRRDPRLERGTIQASSDTQAAAGLQSLVRKALINAGADVRSSQILPADVSGELGMVGVRAVVLADSEQFERALTAIENSKPVMIVREADIQLSAGSRRITNNNEAPKLQIRLDIYSFVRSEE
ncbi:type II secretion system protein GspM [Henriciella sp.]|uniref:type II secretion system protein GspM n=1 Tax=Henriciella sp. TaxID=1968823 RepID=UPI002607D16C|nr:type II secretion system protein GspM [Henriciella sp.]